ncbi:MAG TPA: GNAT family N-acetyltransferase [Candidatus Saccharimonadales bacterium]|nr:GNAT family N-acetyltransferase [Candidatus Saccharimonadales bacterium]
MLEAFAGNLAFTYGTLALRAGRRWLRSDRFSLADGGVPFAFVMNMVVPLGPLPARDITEAAEAFYGGRGYQVWSLWPVDGASDAGLETLASNPVMVRPAGAHRPEPTDLEVREARDGAGIAMFERTVKAAFGFSEVVQQLPPGAVFAPGAAGDPDLRLWVGLAGGEPVATACSAVSDGYIGVYAVGTVPSARRRGYGEVMTAAALGARVDLPATLQASAMGLPVYQRMDFTEVATVERWRRPASV